MYFAKLDDSNKVVQVIVASQEFVDALSGTWIHTDIDGVDPKNYAGVGYTWNPTLVGFIAPQPHPSWILNNLTCQWAAPVPMPTDGQKYRWDESIVNWILAI